MLGRTGASSGRRRVGASLRHAKFTPKATGLDGPLPFELKIAHQGKGPNQKPLRTVEKAIVQFSLIHCTRGALWRSSRARQSRSTRIVNFAESISLLTCSAMERHS